MPLFVILSVTHFGFPHSIRDHDRNANDGPLETNVSSSRPVEHSQDACLPLSELLGYDMSHISTFKSSARYAPYQGHNLVNEDQSVKGD